MGTCADFLLFSYRKMYIPDPLFALVISYLADGDPAPRVLAGFDRTRRVRSWKPGKGTGHAREVMQGSGRDWGAVRRLIDTAVHLHFTGRRRSPDFILVCPYGLMAHVWECLMGKWAAPTGVMRPGYVMGTGFLYRLSYGLNTASVDFMNPRDVQKITHVGVHWFTMFIMQECVADRSIGTIPDVWKPRVFII